jgi:uncharacterized membrane protein
MTDRIECTHCGLSNDPDDCVPIAALGSPFSRQLQRTAHSEWSSEGRVCRACLLRERGVYIRDQLERERGVLSELEREVAGRAATHNAIAEELDQQFQDGLSFGQRVADGVARVGGSWPFVLSFCGVLVVWIVLNGWALGTATFDPYPFILLNLVLSTVAALQAPVIMMSQNRAAARDRLEADEDFKINLKAELEVKGLHEKVDHLLHVQWDRMIDIQETQLELLNEILRTTKRNG